MYAVEGFLSSILFPGQKCLSERGEERVATKGRGGNSKDVGLQREGESERYTWIEWKTDRATLRWLLPLKLKLMMNNGKKGRLD